MVSSVKDVELNLANSGKLFKNDGDVVAIDKELWEELITAYVEAVESCDKSTAAMHEVLQDLQDCLIGSDEETSKDLQRCLMEDE